MNRIALLLVVGLGIAAIGCQDRPVEEQTQPERTPQARAQGSATPGKRRIVDTDLIAFLSKARAAHHAADLAESKQDLGRAIQHVEAIPFGPVPTRTPEVIEVLADAHARLADLRSRVGAFDEALREVDRGLLLARSTTHFRGHLFEMRGIVHQRRMESLQAAGDTLGAEKERDAALEAFNEAIEIQDEVILKALPDDTSPPDPAPPASASPSQKPAP